MEHVNCKYTRRTHDVSADFAVRGTAPFQEKNYPESQPHRYVRARSYALSHANKIELIHPAASTTHSDASKKKNGILGVNLNLYVIRKIK